MTDIYCPLRDCGQNENGVCKSPVIVIDQNLITDKNSPFLKLEGIYCRNYTEVIDKKTMKDILDGVYH